MGGMIAATTTAMPRPAEAITIAYIICPNGDYLYPSDPKFPNCPGGSWDNPFLPDSPPPGGDPLPIFNFPSVFLSPSGFTFIDPILAVGYDYKITAGSLKIAEIVLPQTSGTSSYSIVGDSSGGACSSFQDPLGSVGPNTTFAFSAPVSCFGVRGISLASGLDPSNPLAFVTGLKGDGSGTVSISQIAVTASTDVPGPLPLLAPPALLGLSRKLRTLKRRQRMADPAPVR